MNVKNWIAVDIDNCCANDEWRMDKIDWSATDMDARYEAYHAAAEDDPPWQLPLCVQNRLAQDANAGLLFLTARPESYRGPTMAGILDMLGRGGFRTRTAILRMRTERNGERPMSSAELKGKMVADFLNPNNMPQGVEYKIVFAVDDREDIVQMYTDLGIPAARSWIHEVCAMTPPVPSETVATILRAAADTFEQRNALYADNYKLVGPIMAVLFPQGAPPALLHSPIFHLFELKLVKLTRFVSSGMTHVDSLRDDAVYSAMIEHILKEQGK